MIKCLKCNSNDTRFEYGGERGEAGPFIYCEDYGYEEESEIKERVKEMVLVQYKILPSGEGLELPQYATPYSAGLDLQAAEDVCLHPGDRYLMRTGLAIALPKGFEAQVRPRSGLAHRYGVTVLNAPGTIDADYRGEIMVILINHGKEPWIVGRGDRIAQMVIAPVTTVTLSQVVELSVTERGDGGFGSTGV